jgi:preprotein translocase subunit SecY
MLSAYINSIKIPELRKRILFTLAIIALCRLAANIPCPGVDIDALEELFSRMNRSAGGGLFTMFDLFSGGALQNFAVAALGIMPYISASIIMQLMTPVIPGLEKLQREGETGRAKINQYTRYLTLLICLVQGSAAVRVMLNPGSVFRSGGDIQVVIVGGTLFGVGSVVILTAGTMLLVWLGEQITERGIGNGISLIITVNILSRLPSAGWQMIRLVRSGGAIGGVQFTLIHALILLAMFLVVCGATVALTQGVRKIPIRHAGRMAGRSGSGQTSYLPLRVNFSGVMPIIFGSAILVFPRLVLNAIEFTRLRGWARFFQPGDPWYIVVFGAMIILFSYFWVANQFNPLQIADNLQKQSGYVPGIRPGQPTAEYLDATMTRITFAGSIFLTSIAVIPMLMANSLGVPYSIASFFGGTSLLIMVGVMLDTMRHVESHLLSKHYDGFLRKGKLRSRRG